MIKDIAKIKQLAVKFLQSNGKVRFSCLQGLQAENNEYLGIFFNELFKYPCMFEPMNSTWLFYIIDKTIKRLSVEHQLGLARLCLKHGNFAALNALSNSNINLGALFKHEPTSESCVRSKELSYLKDEMKNKWYWLSQQSWLVNGDTLRLLNENDALTILPWLSADLPEIYNKVVACTQEGHILHHLIMTHQKLRWAHSESHIQECFSLLAQSLHQQGEIDRKDKHGKTCLYYAVVMANTKLIEQLLALGADPNCKTGKNGHGQSPLELAGQQRSQKKLGFYKQSPRAMSLILLEQKAMELLLKKSIESVVSQHPMLSAL